MCFSLEASITAAGVCSVVGVTALWRSAKEERMLAAIPLLFGIHQAIEAVVWATGGAGLWGRYAVLLYCAIAYCLWPVYVPQ